MSDRYMVVGNPIAHSKSPLIHALFAKQTGQALTYKAVRIEVGNFHLKVQEFIDSGGKGLNITVPFKQEAWRFAKQCSALAQRAEAVNTLLVKEAEVGCFGENTDGIGLIRDLCENHGVPLANRNVLLIGAGGASRGILASLLAQQPAQLMIANRTEAKAHALAQIFTDLGPVSGCGFSALSGHQFGVIIHATSAGLQGELPPLPIGLLQKGGHCYDLMYGDKPTAFVCWGREQNAAKSLDGLGMLVEQAAESFWLWRGIRPATHSVIQQLRTSMPVTTQKPLI